MQVKEAEQAVLSALASVKGRGASGMDVVNQELLNVAVEVLERDGGVPGGALFRCNCLNSYIQS